MKVFIVEDSALMCARITQVIAEIGGASACGTASNAITALSCIHDTNPDVLILDIQLREGNGLAVLKQIKSERADIRAVVLGNFSPTANEVYRKAAHAAGADFFLDKSTEFGQLKSILSGWQAQHQSGIGEHTRAHT